MVVERADELFPDYYVVAFDLPHVHEQEEATPALALIRQDFGSWWVVLIDTSDDLEESLLPAVSILRRTSYGVLDAEAIVARCDLDAAQVTQLTREEQPGVLAIVSTLHPDWSGRLREEDALITFFEVFEARDGHRVVRVNGEQPPAVGALVCSCRTDAAAPRLLALDDPAALGDDDEFLIDFEGGATRWHRMSMGSNTYLYPLGTHRLPHDTGLELVRVENGRLFFRSEGASTSA